MVVTDKLSDREKEAVAVELAKLNDTVPAIIAVASMARTLYEALDAEEFTPEQALELTKIIIPHLMMR